jgi:threonyl-tRNA synthetase
MKSHQELNASRTDPWFAIDEYSPGSVIYLPSGLFIFQQLSAYLRKHYKLNGYQEVQCPDMWKKHLWNISGHSTMYEENMFHISSSLENKNEHMSLRAMSCPCHHRIYAMQPRNSNNFPLRLAEFGSVHRNEAEGSLRGLFRVRKFHQDDGHIFCTKEQVSSEIRNFLTLVNNVYSLFNLDYELELSTRPDKFIGEIEEWDLAESVLQTELEISGRKWKLNKGDGAFYGPKIDVHVTDSLGRSHQCGTIQLDFQLPERFDIWYTDSETNSRLRPSVLHRAVFGSLERIIGILLEHYQGNLPLWLSDKQFLICSLYKPNQEEVQDRVKVYCEKLKADLLQHNWNIRVDIDISDTHIKQKVKTASEKGYHYILVIGDKELNQNTVTIRHNRDVNFNKSFQDVVNLWQIPM